MTKPVGPYSPILRAGEWLVCSGQVGLRDGALVEGGVRAETTQALDNLRGMARQGVQALLSAEGAGSAACPLQRTAG